MHASMEESTSNPWARVCDLVDLKGPVPSSTSSASVARSSLGGESSSRRGAAQAKLDEEDFYRATEKMRSLIIQVRERADIRQTPCLIKFSGLEYLTASPLPELGMGVSGEGFLGRGGDRMSLGMKTDV